MTPVRLAALAAAMLAAPASAQAPVGGPAPLGGFAAVDSIVTAGVRDGLYPGAVLLVGRRDTVLHARGYGHFTWDSTGPVPDPASTPWDLASLTKVVATTPVALRLVAEGRLDLDAPVATYLPSFGGRGRDAITVRHLLTHTSGLQAGLPLGRLARTRDEAIMFVLADLPIDPPGTRVRYSDLNAILLGLVVEAVTREGLDAVAEREVFAPLGMRHTRFGLPPAEQPLAPPTLEMGSEILQGVVQDPSARRLGGVAGHAGLFATAGDLGRYAQVWLDRGPRGTALAGGELVDQFLARDTLPGARYLGWDAPSDDAGRPSAFGTLVSHLAFGHTGWTGTQMWIDPAQDLFVVFLTNRSFAGGRRSLARIRDVRGAVADAVVRAVRPCEVLASLEPAPAC